MAHDHTLDGHSHGHSHSHDHDGHDHHHDHDHGHHDHDRVAEKPHDHGIWTRDHVFLGQGHSRAEAKAKWAAIVTAVFMCVEIACGLAYHSMALLADGAHMATHVGALGLAAGAYWLARRHSGSGRFTFGSGKFGDLAAFASAIVLGITATLSRPDLVETQMLGALRNGEVDEAALKEAILIIAFYAGWPNSTAVNRGVGAALATFKAEQAAKGDKA